MIVSSFQRKPGVSAHDKKKSRLLMHYLHLLHKMNQLSSAQSVKRNSRRDKGCKDLLQQNTTQVHQSREEGNVAENC